MNFFSRLINKNKNLQRYSGAIIVFTLYDQFRRKNESQKIFSLNPNLLRVTLCDRNDNSLSAIESLDHDKYSYDASEDDQTISNWSSTHSCTPDHIYYPKSASEVVSILRKHNQMNTKIRPIGSALSPNGIGMCDHKNNSSNKDKDYNLINVSYIDHIIVHDNKKTVTVGAGATVNNVLKELKKSGLTLSNFSSIQEQQIAG